MTSSTPPRRNVKRPQRARRRGGVFSIPKAGNVEPVFDHTQAEPNARPAILVEADDEATLALVADVAKKMGASVTAANAGGG